jgi:hypothetical protein
MGSIYRDTLDKVKNTDDYHNADCGYENITQAS